MSDTDATTPKARRRPRLRKAMIISGSIVGGLILVVGALGAWFLYAPTPSEPELDAQVERGTIEVDGMQREYLAVIPADLPADAPVVLAFHGSNMDAATMRATTGYRFDELAVERGFIALYPEGYGKTWHDCRAATPYAARLDDIDDIAFVRALVDSLAEEHGTSREQVFATGLSNGGHFAYRLATEAPDLVKGIAAFAAAYPAEDSNVCEWAGAPVPTMIVLGTSDPINPFTGGEASAFGTRLGNVRSADDTAAYLGERNGDTMQPVTETFTNTAASGDSDATRTTYTGDAPVVLFAVEGGGHVVPNPNYAQPRIMGGTSMYLDGPLAAIDFFLGE
ncbi:alpha/beta hydrolase family esterase [Agromyces sp. GXS1127]|uniref:alpha/beta hydrolase family esterase n=1 Tax=Agromyces sp. GXS1127 TaxID=3424181 RepID=UPI003D31A42E